MIYTERPMIYTKIVYIIIIIYIIMMIIITYYEYKPYKHKYIGVYAAKMIK